MNMIRSFVVVLAGLAVFSQLGAQSLMVGVRATYSGGGSGASLQVGDPVNLSVEGSGVQEQSGQVELQVDMPMLTYVTASDIGVYAVTFSPPTGFGMLIDGERKTTVTGNLSAEVRITLVRSVDNRDPAGPVGEASSIQWLPPSSGYPRWPIIAFELGSGKSGERLPPLMIPVKKRTSQTNDFVPPDSLEIVNYTPASGGFEFSVPATRVKLEVDPGSSGNFTLKFFEPGASTEFASYLFNIVSWPGDAGGYSKRVEVTKSISGGTSFVTAIDGYFSAAGTSGNAGVNTLRIEDWHQTGSDPARVIYGTRTRVNQDTIVPYEWRISNHWTDTIEVRPSLTSSDIIASTKREFNQYTIGEDPDFADIMLPKQTTEGIGDGDYLTVYYNHPDHGYVRGSQSPGGRRRFEVDGLVSGTSQRMLTVHETWLDSSPDFSASGGVTSGGMKTTTHFENGAGFDLFQWPQSIETTLGTTILAKSTFLYAETSGIVTVTRRDYSSASDYLESVIKRYPPNHATVALRDRLHSVQLPTGAKQSFGYMPGSWSGTGWSADYRIITLSGAASGGNAVTGVDSNTVDSVQMHPNKSTKTVEYLWRGRPVRRETWVYISGIGATPNFNTGDPVAWETFSYTVDGRLASRTSSTSSSYTATWTGTRKTSQTDETGHVTSFSYDGMDRVAVIERAAVGSLPAQRVALEYDASHRIRFRRVGPATGEQLVTETEYDRGGRVKRIKQPGQGTTSSAGAIVTEFSYPNGGRDQTTNYNVGTSLAASKAVVRHTDGRVKDITGTAVVHEHYTYDFDGLNRQRVTRKLGPLAKRPQVTVVDLLGRPVEERIDGFGTSGSAKPLVTHQTYYPVSGLLKKVFTMEEGGTPLQVTGDRIFEYDAFGQLKAVGLDLNANGELNPASTDRFEEFENTFYNDGSTWWHRLTGTVYHTNNLSATYTSKSDTRLTGLSGMVAQTVDEDFWSNKTTRTVVADTTGKSHRVRTKLPDSTTQERTLIGSLLVTDRWFDDMDPDLTGTPVLAATYAYDARGRATSVTDARTGTAQTNYWYGTALPHQQYDARNALIATHSYNGAGRLASTTTPAGATGYAYTLRGELYEESGTDTYPSRREYSDYGELKQLRTYRNALTGAADVTSWGYDDNTGWLVSKTDAATQIVSYDYEFVAGFRNVIRHSARNPSAPTTTKYALTTGDLVKLDYSDGTTDVDFLAYDRMGNVTQVQDATGVRTLAYQNGQLISESLPAWYNNLVLTTDYHSSTSTTSNTVKGRYHRWKLGTATDADKEMSVVYGYDDFGRINGVTADYKAQGARAALNVPASYQYETSASHWETFTQGNFSAARDFEANRDVLLSITSAHTASTTGTVATFGYGTDDAGRREWATQAGMAFGDVDPATYYKFTYNAQRTFELASATGYRGANPSDTANPLPGRGFSFNYDTAGNRTTVAVDSDSVTYRDGTGGGGSPGANNLNQPRSRGTLKTRVSGSSHANAAITVAGNSVSRQASSGTYWDFAMPSYSESASVTVNATMSGASPENGSVQVYTRPATETLIWDADGNLTGDARWTYEWDAEDRLKRMYTNSTGLGWGAPNRELLFTYDYLGRRVRKVYKLNGSTVTDRKFFYQGWNLIAELDTATNKIVRSYAWGLDIDSTLGGTGGVGGLALETLHTDTALTAYHVSYDGSGNVAALVNRATGAVAASYEYGPFGETVRTQVFDTSLAAAGQPFRFSTKYTDSETGLVYYGYRYYDPSLGRFINRDPIGEAGGLNLYGFVGNSSVNRWDYLGLEDDYVHPNEKRRTYINGIDPEPFRIPDPVDDTTGEKGTFADYSVNTPAEQPRGKTALHHHRNEALTRAPNSADFIYQPRMVTSTITGRTHPEGTYPGHLGDPVFAGQVARGSILVASIALPGGGVALLVRTAAGRLIVYAAGVGQFVADPDNLLNAVGVLPAGSAVTKVAAENIAEGSFLITKRGWQGYPSNPNVPKPEGSLRLLEGAEKEAARKAANNANRATHRADTSLAGKEIHEIKPVKFGGSPTDPNNKVPLTPEEHQAFTTWWRQLQRDLEK